MRVFRSIGYTHILDQERSKLDHKSKRYIFIGYDSSSKGYKLYNPNSSKIVISRDVEFDEEDFWEWSTQEEEKYDFFPFLEEEEEESRNDEPTTPFPSPTNPSTPLSSSSSGSSSERQPHMRSLKELYKVTENLNDDLILFCHFVDCEPIGFEEQVKDEKWRNAMDEESKQLKRTTHGSWQLLQKIKNPLE